MSFKMRWLASGMLVGVCVVGGMGCASTGGSDDQNYKILDERRDLFDTQPRSPGSDVGASRDLEPVEPGYVVSYADGTTAETPAPTTSDAVLAPPPMIATEEPVEVASVPPAMASADSAPLYTAPTQESGPSINGIDRSGWSTMAVGPDSGTVTHYPRYFRDVNMGPEWKRVDFDASLEDQADAALDGHAPVWMGHRSATGIVVQPVKAFVDTALLPVRALVTQPVWTSETSPNLDK